jgi:hypothetical protein
MNLGHMEAYSLSHAEAEMTYNDLDDLKSMRRFLKRALAPDTDEPYIYIEPIEAEFMRPAVTVKLVRTSPVGTVQARRPSYDVEHALVVTSYGRDRAETVSLGERVWRLFNEGDSRQGAAYRVPMWDFASGMRLSRWMRVPRENLSVGLDTADEGGHWSRPIEMRVKSPRVRPIRRVPTMASVTFRFS